ncbi:uncharacterized protein LOC581459 isoform X1 [Strongylocentrotus purpuratus]|uniref:Death domain-containing protein n=1 Tax=Strongylocentrotus purpuratus TaxID=7668 RepID=A0A7M7RHJ2_STRPU|nr:uncharacterized protein LOC581459 isoform X1 [Strongylocentrotus purpuratus]XP_030845212.1 uncharacterized protein LOC581459 isoform X1 [Strongylocentrotus purpuratus]XP_800137.2 uncharacterized protein LOC581459 isoform X1 [Strongylocentrotus purpuratus]
MASFMNDLASATPSSQNHNAANLTELELLELATKLYPDDFFRLGVRLGFEESRLSHFKHDNPNNIEGALSTMLIRWRKNQSGKPSLIRQRLAHALKHVQRLDLSESVYLQEDVLPTFKDIGLKENTGEWHLDKTIALPTDKAEWMKACIALPGRRVAVGYRSGSIDIIDIENDLRERILDQLKIRSLAQLSDGTLVICNDDVKSVKIYTCTLGGKHTVAKPLYTVRQSGTHRSLSVDAEDNIYLGLRGFKQIEVVKPISGALTKTIKTAVDPWSIAVMRTGNIAITNSLRGTEDAVCVLTQGGDIVSRMPGVKDARQFIAVDSKDSIYAAIKAKNGMVKIRKYSGHDVEVVTENVESVTKRRDWIQLACLSPNELVMCDAKSMFVFKQY